MGGWAGAFKHISQEHYFSASEFFLPCHPLFSLSATYRNALGSGNGLPSSFFSTRKRSQEEAAASRDGVAGEKEEGQEEKKRRT